MKRFFKIGLGWMAVLMVLSASASTELKIPPRRQWDNNLGYCGECTIQQIALYYGAYISQYRARELVDPTQRQDVWIPENSSPIFRALGLKTEKWDMKRAKPQHKAYLAWIKGHLRQGHPVAMDMFVQGGGSPTYDHIVTAIGFDSPDETLYHDDDILTFNDNFRGEPVDRFFGTLEDTRSMNGNGATYAFCIPRDKNRGLAVTGIRDATGEAKRVSVKLSRWDEPNISLGEAPVRLDAKVRMGGLTVGKSYSLLRYDDFRNVPTRHYLASNYSRLWIFKATRAAQVISDQFMSDAIVIYRCVPTLIE